MGVKYPLTKTERKQYIYSVDLEYVNGGTYPASCLTPITREDVTVVNAVDTATLGASPSNWRQLIATGGNATSTLLGTRHRAFVGGGGYSYIFVSGNKCIRGHASGALGGNQISFPALITGASPIADSLAREKLLARYLEAKNSWRGGNFMAEFAETVHMLRHPIHSLYKNITGMANRFRSIRKLHRLPKAYAEAAGDIWLTYSFGWKPLFEDISDGNKAIKKLAAGTDHDTKRISANGSSTDVTSQVIGNVTSGINNYASYYSYLKTSRSVRYFGALRARPESFATVAETFGFSPSDIIPAIWEAIPWSFFVDYFVNVQQVIDSWRFASSDFSWLAVTSRNTTQRIHTPWFDANNHPGILLNCAVGGTSAATTWVSRGPMNSIPYGTFRFKIPGFGSLKWVNIGSLMATINRSRP